MKLNTSLFVLFYKLDLFFSKFLKICSVFASCPKFNKSGQKPLT